MSRRVVVVGAGIAGASVADHLARETTASVRVLDRSTPASETTAKSGAFVGFWGHEPPSLVPLLRYGVDFYGRLLSGVSSPRFVHGGRLRLATTPDGDARVRDDVEAWFGRRPDGPTTLERGAPVQYLPGSRLSETLLLPGLATDDVAGALYSPGVGAVDDPSALARRLLERATDAGATVESDARVTGLLTDDAGRRVTGVRTDAGTYDADAVVACAGPWNRRLLATAGVELPVRNTRGPMLVVDADAHGIPALYHEETGVYTRTNRDGSLYVGQFPGQYAAAERLDPDAVSDHVPDALRRRCLSTLADLLSDVPPFPDLEDRVVDEWVGVRTLTPDGLPAVGDTGVEGLYAVAFNANGVQYAPAAGRLLAARLADEARDVGFPTDPFALGRFD